jgi:hypothetical protein
MSKPVTGHHIVELIIMINLRKNKTGARIETESIVNREDYKSMTESSVKHANVKNKRDMIDYLLNLENIMSPQRSASLNELIDADNESKVDNSDLVDE